MDRKVTVISLGGSIIAPHGLDVQFLKSFITEIKTYLDGCDSSLIFVCGGGALARDYQNSVREIMKPDADSADWLGIRATHLNAEAIRILFEDYASSKIVTDPNSEDIMFNSRVLVGGGWKPGFSTDTDAVLLARRFNASVVVNLSNIKKVYSADPKNNPDAIPLDRISWADFLKITGDEWVPGKNTPFDPVASKLAMESGISVICSDGRDIQNTISILNGKEFNGTLIS